MKSTKIKVNKKHKQKTIIIKQLPRNIDIIDTSSLITTNNNNNINNNINNDNSNDINNDNNDNSNNNSIIINLQPTSICETGNTCNTSNLIINTIDTQQAANEVNSVTPVIPNNVLPDDVNITIKSCKNISAKQALLIIPITKFFKKRHTLNKLISILKGESISLRLIDWFVTNYCKKYNIMYNLNLYRPHNLNETEIRLHNDAFDNFIIIHNNYKGQLKAYSKKNFDPFCRRNRIRFYYEDNKYFITTVGQLNFFKWALENYIINYIQDYITLINDDMNLRCEIITKKKTKQNALKAMMDKDANNIESSNTNNSDISQNDLISTTDSNLNGTYDGNIYNSGSVSNIGNTDNIGNTSANTQLGINIYNKNHKGITRKTRKEISYLGSKTLSIHNYPTTLIFD